MAKHHRTHHHPRGRKKKENSSHQFFCILAREEWDESLGVKSENDARESRQGFGERRRRRGLDSGEQRKPNKNPRLFRLAMQRDVVHHLDFRVEIHTRTGTGTAVREGVTLEEEEEKRKKGRTMELRGGATVATDYSEEEHHLEYPHQQTIGRSSTNSARGCQPLPTRARSWWTARTIVGAFSIMLSLALLGLGIKMSVVYDEAPLIHASFAFVGFTVRTWTSPLSLFELRLRQKPARPPPLSHGKHLSSLPFVPDETAAASTLAPTLACTFVSVWLAWPPWVMCVSGSLRATDGSMSRYTVNPWRTRPYTTLASSWSLSPACCCKCVAICQPHCRKLTGVAKKSHPFHPLHPCLQGDKKEGRRRALPHRCHGPVRWRWPRRHSPSTKLPRSRGSHQSTRLHGFSKRDTRSRIPTCVWDTTRHRRREW